MFNLGGTHEGGIIGEEQDNLTLISDLEEALRTKKMTTWETFPDSDMCVAIFPNRFFPDLDLEDNEYHTLIVSPDPYQFKDADSYYGFRGVAFIMTPTTDELKKFINDLKAEVEGIQPKEKSKSKKKR